MRKEFLIKNMKVVPIIMSLCLVFSGCSGKSGSSSSGSGSTNTGSGTTISSTSNPIEADETHATDAESKRTEITGSFSITSETSGGVSNSGNVYTITKAGEYTLTGLLSDGQVIVDVGDSDEVTLILKGTSITCSTAAPIYINNGSKVKIKAEEDTFNEVVDSRATETSDDDKDTSSMSAAEASKYAGAAIFAKCDMNIVGKGALVVTGNYNNGVQSKDDLSIKNICMRVNAANNCIKGNDSVEIESGDIIGISSAGDGIKTSNSDVSSKGNQRGVVTISGGKVDMYVAQDGIDAAYDVVISGDGYVNIYTDSYSDYSGSNGTVVSGTDMYLVVASSYYSTDYDFYGYFYNNDSSTGVWSKATYSTMVSSSGSSKYYGLKLTEPSGYSNVAFYRFKSGAQTSTTSYDATTSGDTVNSSMNAYLISQVTLNTMSGDWCNLNTSSGNGQSGSSKSSTAYSAKGIKADNEVNISGATINIYATDDAIHANDDVTLENGSTGAGNVTVSGGTITATSGDDGIHADNVLTISGGYVNIVKSYEGLEAADIEISGGSIYVYASDDGLNATTGSSSGGMGGMGGFGRTSSTSSSSSSSSAIINITGGYLDVTTASGDTDGIDSNGNFKMSGGFVIVKGGSSSGSVSGSVDTDGTVMVTGGTIIALGGICETPENSVNAYVSSGTSCQSGDYSLKDGSGNEICSFSLSSTYSSIWVCSDKLTTGTKYTLYNGSSSVINWTQTSGTAGSSGSSGMGGNQGGNQGGMGGRMR